MKRPTRRKKRDLVSPKESTIRSVAVQEANQLKKKEVEGRSWRGGRKRSVRAGGSRRWQEELTPIAILEEGSACLNSSTTSSANLGGSRIRQGKKGVFPLGTSVPLHLKKPRRGKNIKLAKRHKLGGKDEREKGEASTLRPVLTLHGIPSLPKFRSARKASIRGTSLLGSAHICIKPLDNFRRKGTERREVRVIFALVGRER